MGSIFQSFQQGKQGQLPLSRRRISSTDDQEHQTAGAGQCIRTRLSSLSFKIHHQMKQSPAASSSIIKSWWAWGWAWALSRKPIFAKDLEMNEEETVAIGCHNKGSWKHLVYKIRTNLLGSHNVGLPLTNNRSSSFTRYDTI